jgi:hypothetical protein
MQYFIMTGILDQKEKILVEVTGFGGSVDWLVVWSQWSSHFWIVVSRLQLDSVLVYEMYTGEFMGDNLQIELKRF